MRAVLCCHQYSSMCLPAPLKQSAAASMAADVCKTILLCRCTGARRLQLPALSWLLTHTAAQGGKAAPAPSADVQDTYTSTI